jgi:hypothetical protein
MAKIANSNKGVPNTTSDNRGCMEAEPILEEVLVQVPLLNSTFTYQLPRTTTIGAIKQKAEADVVMHDNFELGSPLQDYALFETNEKLILNASVPIPNTATLSKVKTVSPNQL